MATINHQGTEHFAGTGDTFSHSWTAPSNEAGYTIIVEVGLRDTSVSVVSVYNNADAFTQRITKVGAGSSVTVFDIISGFVLGVNDIVVNLSASSEYIVRVTWFDNVLSYRSSSSSSGNGTSATVTHTPLNPNIMLGDIVIGNVAPTTVVCAAGQTDKSNNAGTQLRMDTATKTGRAGADMGWTLAAAQDWVAVVVEYNQLPTPLTASGSLSPSSTITGTMTPGFVCREETEIFETDSVTVEVVV